MSTDRTFITNEDGQSLHERFRVLLGNNTRHFDCLVGYFFISGFYKLYPALTKTEKIRILVGIKTDRATYNLIQEGKQQEFILESHAQAKDAATSAVRNELEKSEDTADVEEGVRKFVEWISPPTAMGLPRNRESADCSTDAKNASASKWTMVRDIVHSFARRISALNTP